jgi:DNA-directed RNA polymerase specialized sigma subunit
MSQRQGAPTVRLCEMFREMATRILGKSAYRGYDRSTKEDLASEAVLKCIKAVKNYKPERRASCFAYYTRVIDTSNFDQLEKHYRQINIKRALKEKAAQNMAAFNPTGA